MQMWQLGLYAAQDLLVVIEVTRWMQPAYHMNLGDSQASALVRFLEHAVDRPAISPRPLFGVRIRAEAASFRTMICGVEVHIVNVINVPFLARTGFSAPGVLAQGANRRQVIGQIKPQRLIPRQSLPF